MAVLADVIVYSAYADRPAFGIEGRLHLASDQSTLSIDTGSAWVEYTFGGSGAVAPGDAEYIVAAADATLTGEHLLGDVIDSGLLADRPSFGVAGRLYYATDGPALYRDTGSAWEEITVSASGGMTNPMTTTGDVIYSSDGSGTPARLAIGTEGHVLKVVSGIPGWAAESGGGSAVMPPVLLYPFGNEPPASNYATIDTRNAHPVLDFDSTTDESAVWSAILPRSYAGGGLTVYLHWAASSATSGDVIWNVALERIGDEQQDIDSDGFASVQSVTATAPATSGNVSIDSVAFTDGAQMDSIAAGELFRIKVTRDADNLSDTMTGDAELLAVEIKET